MNGSLWEPSWLWSHSSCFYNYRCNQYTSLLMLWVRISIRARCTTLCDKVCQWLAKSRWFSPGTPVHPTDKTGHHGIAEILLKVALNTITQTRKQYVWWGKITDVTVFSKWKEQTIPRFSIIVFSICDQDVKYWRTYQ